MNNRALPELAYLHACLRLAGGAVFWRSRPPSHFSTPRIWKIWNTRFAGKQAGYSNRRYMKIGIDGVQYQANRIVCFMATGIDPAGSDVDHRDLNTLNDDPANLRIASRAQNQQNRGIYKNNTSGVKGVCWVTRDSRWLASVSRNGKRYFARFDTIEDADQWARNVRTNLHGEFTRHI